MSEDDPWDGYPPDQPIGRPQPPEIELVSLVCECGHSVAGLPGEDQPCHACLYDETDPHTCALWRTP